MNTCVNSGVFASTCYL